MIDKTPKNMINDCIFLTMAHIKKRLRKKSLQIRNFFYVKALNTFQEHTKM